MTSTSGTPTHPVGVGVRAFSHVATITADLDRFRRFYEGIVGLGHLVTLRMGHKPHLRHVMLATGPHSVLHAFEVPGYDPQAQGIGADIGQRGRVDHVGLLVDDREALCALRDRLVAAGASDGVVTPLGPMLSVHFRDPDGLEGEVNCPNPDYELRAEDPEVEELGDPALWASMTALGPRVTRRGDQAARRPDWRRARP